MTAFSSDFYSKMVLKSRKIGANLPQTSGFYLFYATEVVGWVGQDKNEAGGPPASEGFSTIGSYKLRPL
jgi:hypothetical protein